MSTLDGQPGSADDLGDFDALADVLGDVLGDPQAAPAGDLAVAPAPAWIESGAGESHVSPLDGSFEDLASLLEDSAPAELARDAALPEHPGAGSSPNEGRADAPMPAAAAVSGSTTSRRRKLTAVSLTPPARSGQRTAATEYGEGARETTARLALPPAAVGPTGSVPDQQTPPGDLPVLSAAAVPAVPMQDLPVAQLPADELAAALPVLPEQAYPVPAQRDHAPAEPAIFQEQVAVSAPVGPAALRAVSGDQQLLDLPAWARNSAHARRGDRYDLMTALWPTVTDIQNLISSDADLSRLTSSFVLTRDIEQVRADRARLEESVLRLLAAHRIPLGSGSAEEVEVAFDLLYDALVGLGPLGDLWRDPDVTEITVDDFDQIGAERFGRLYKTRLTFRDRAHAQRLARELSLKMSDRSLGPSIPVVGAQLPGARVQFVYDPCTDAGVSITIRKFGNLRGMADLLRGESLSLEMRDFLVRAIQARANVLVSGGTNTGKTTLINGLSEFIPSGERVITVEQVREISLGCDHKVHLVSKERASSDDRVIVTQAELLVSALRMRPDRIIVGEIREPAEALQMVRAAVTGHDGTMTTLHATDPDTAVNMRLADLLIEASMGAMTPAVAVRNIAQSLDLVVQVTRHRSGRRFVSRIGLVDVAGLHEGRIDVLDLFTGEFDNGRGRVCFRQVGDVPPNSALGDKLRDAGV